ncbi:protein transport protein HofC [Pantoea sp. LMR881]|uniref:protein transport protein HofC n=1 Tax=Pantoea sp. LMR881 TaxID=3014336 RepID=UPI0022AF5046|nr:protein transport protein HofC [Pantoea sp. LMR881]MCZ4059281.1 protein transport protein HofC [Pantoea sp. LMR881]
MANLNLYNWQAVDNKGELQNGNGLAPDADCLLSQLTERDLLPVSWKREKVYRPRDWKWQQKIDLIRQLATLLKAGLPLSEGLTLLAEGHPHSGWRTLLLTLQQRVLAGEPFSQAMRHWPDIFPPLYSALMEVGELTGQLDVCCGQLAQQQARQQFLWNKVIKALRYPLFILLIAIIVSCGMLLFVLPEFVSVYAAFDAPLPAFTAAVIQLSQGLQAWGVTLALIMILMLYGWQQLRRHSTHWQRHEQRLLLHLPVVAGLWRGSQLAQIYTLLQLTQQAGLTLLQGLQAVQVTLSSLVWRDAIVALQQHIAEGKPLHQALTDHPLFSPLCYQLIRVGEEAGTLDTMLARLAEWHEEQTLTRADSLAASLEPMMMVVIGGIVGTLVIAMYLPVFGLGEAMH